MFPAFPKKGPMFPCSHRLHTGEHRTLFPEKGPMFPAIYQSLKIFKLGRDIHVMTANQRSTGQLSAVQSGVNYSMEEKVMVAV